LFAPTLLALGMVAPYAIRLRLAAVEDAGKAAGGLYALSTAGSIFGSFVPVMILLPEIGTRNTFAVLSGTLIVMSISGLLLERPRAISMAVVLVGAAAIAALFLGTGGEIRPAYRGTLLAEQESEYNYIQVLQDGSETVHAIHSIYNPGSLETGGPWDYFTLGPAIAGNESPANALIVGLAGGTAARQLHAAYPGIEVDGIEIDQAIVDVGRKYFALTDAVANVTVADGRYAIETTDKTYDLICLDAYRQPYIPFHLATVEFFELASRHLEPGAVLAVNAGRTENDFRLVDALSHTLAQVFETVIVVDVERYDNSMIFATHQVMSVDQFAGRLRDAGRVPLAGTVAGWALQHGKIRTASTSGQVLTDDHAPIEWIIDQIIIDEAIREDT
jgi:spermidine synthase